MDLGHYQGQLIHREDPLVALIEERYQRDYSSVEPDQRWIVTTHDCCFVGEGTSLEVMRATYPGTVPSTKESTGHSAKRICLPNSQGVYMRVEADRRVVLKATKKRRGSIRLEPGFAGEPLDVFRTWLGHRYSRSALPDKVGNFLSDRGISNGLSDLLDEMPETHQVLIKGHHGADDPALSETITGVRLVVLLGPDANFTDSESERRAQWRRKVLQLDWADEDAEVAGVALEGLEFVSVANMSLLEFLQYDVIDFDYVSHRHQLGSPHDEVDRA